MFALLWPILCAAVLLALGCPEAAGQSSDVGAADTGIWQIREITCRDLGAEAPTALEMGREEAAGVMDYYREEAEFLVEAELRWSPGDGAAENSGSSQTAGGTPEGDGDSGTSGEGEVPVSGSGPSPEAETLSPEAALLWLQSRLLATGGGAEVDPNGWIRQAEAERKEDGEETIFLCRVTLSVRGDGVYELRYEGEGNSSELLRRFGIDGTAPDLTAEAEGPEGGEASSRPETGGASSPADHVIYNRDVSVRILGREPADGAGLARAGWRVIRDPESGEVTREEVQEIAGPGDLCCLEKELRLVVDAALNNSSEVRAEIWAEDRLGNRSQRELPLDIDVTPPRIELAFAGPKEKLTRWTRKSREYQITIRERAEHFRESDAKEGLRVAVTDASGREIREPEGILWGTWETLEGENPDDTGHRITLTCQGEGNYDWSLTYRDLAGNEAGPVSVTAEGEEIPEDTEGLWQFSVDRTPPTGRLRAVSSEGEAASWQDYPNRDSEGLWSAGEIRFRLEASDEISSVASAEYLITDTWKVRTRKSLGRMTGWKSCGTAEEDFLTIAEDRQALVWIRLIDPAGNQTFLGSGGLLVDRTPPVAAADLPRITLALPESGVFLYSGDVAIAVEAEDPPVRGSASGLQAVRWQLGQGGRILDAGTLWDAGSRPRILPEESGFRGALTVDSGSFEGDGLWVRVQAADRTGNLAQSEVRFGIDVTAPEIQIRFDENDPKTPGYYRVDRTAEVTITDRHLQIPGVQMQASSGEGTEAEIGRWIWHGDSRVSVKIRFREEGDYTFAVACRDAAGNAAGSPVYAEGTKDPEHFVIDRTAPEIRLESGEEASEGRYFADERRIRISVREKYFDPELVEIRQTAEYLGDPIDPPEIRWRNSGELHVAELRYVRDGDFSLRLSAEDPAGNTDAGADISRAEPLDAFTVDTLPVEISVEGISEGDILGLGPAGVDPEAVVRIRFSDLHFADYQAELVRSRVIPEGERLRIETDADVTGSFLRAASGGEAPELILRIPPRSETGESNDGLYCLSLRARDLAGHEGEPVSVHFSVNRFGSVFVLDSYVRELAGEACISRVSRPLVLREYNPDPVEEASVVLTRDGGRETAAVRRTEGDPAGGTAYLSEGETPEEGAAGHWYCCRYEILPENFGEDGRYHLRIATRDRAGHRADSGEMGGEISFIVDQTPPEIRSLTGLEQAVAETEALTVALELFDPFGVASCRAWVDEKLVLERTEVGEIYSGDSFSVEGEGPHHIRLKITDRAGNELDTDARDEEGNYCYRPAFPFERDVTLHPGRILPGPSSDPGGEDITGRGEPAEWNRRRGTAAAGGLLLILAAGGAIVAAVSKKHRKVLDRR